MAAFDSRSERAQGIQNALAIAVFSVLLCLHLAAYLLSLDPSSEMFWSLMLIFNRIAGPAMRAFDFGFGQGPVAALAVLTFATVLPAVAWHRRHWLATAAAGHVALALCGTLAYDGMRRAQMGRPIASLDQAVGPAVADTNALTLAALTIILLGLCLLNHVKFFCTVRTAAV